MKVAIYLCVGSESQIEKESTSTECLGDIQQYCQSKGWRRTSAYIAEGIKVKL